MTIITTRADLDSIAGTPEHAAFLQMLAGSMWRLEKDDAAQQWVAVEDDSTIARFGFAREDFPGAQPPELPIYVPEPVPSQRELDELRYKRRAGVRDELIAWMAADNMSRVRSGEWTVAQLTSLMTDPAIFAAQQYMQTLSYELAAQSIAQASHELMTPEIKAAWVAKLQENFYLVP